MKTDHKPNVNDELNEEAPPNDIAEMLQQFVPYWRQAVGAVVLGVLAIGGFQMLQSNRDAAVERGWTDFFSATANRDPVRLEEIATASGSTPVGPWAQQAAAQAKLVEGSAAVYTDRDKAAASFQEAVDGFTAAIGLAADDELIRQRSMLGLAQAYEGLNDLPNAKQSYQKLIDAFPETSIADQAQQRMESLSDPATSSFYEWFFAQQPPAALPASGEVPGLPFGVPDEPDISLPNFGDLPTDGDSSDTESTDGAATDASTGDTDASEGDAEPATDVTTDDEN